MDLKVKRLTDTAKLPTRGSSFAAGFDLYADDYAIIQPGQTVKISTGIAVEIPEGYFGALYARSGLATKEGLRPANCVGVIDADYRGPVVVALHSDFRPMEANGVTAKISKGDRIAQLVIQKYEDVEITEVAELSDTVRGEGGFGSTGTK